MNLIVRRTWDDRPVERWREVRVRVSSMGDALELRCRATLVSDTIPGPPGPTSRLWEHEVVEWFFGNDAGEYTEVELGPFGNHLVLTFDGYRNRRAELLPIVYTARVTSTTVGRRWSGAAIVPRALLPKGALRMNVCAIQPGPVHLQWQPARGAQPDFHDARCWVPLQG